MLDVLEVEEVWVAKESNRAPRSREELAVLSTPSSKKRFRPDRVALTGT